MFYGKPIIAWSIEAALSSNLFDRIIVSTDDAEIAKVARRYGAEVPFIRPHELSDDYTGTIPVLSHATNWAGDQGLVLSAVCCIYATAPFLQASDLVRGWNDLNEGDWQYTFAVTDYPAPIFRSFKEIDNGGVEMFFPEHFSTRSQDLPVALHDAGQFYWGRPAAWTAGKTIFAHYSKPVIIPRWRVQDIDTPEDWERAELLASMIIGTKRIG
jgi:N-acylneuraminate cytidylyltransferase